MTQEVATVEQFIHALRCQDLQAAIELYEPEAVWEVHVPGADGRQVGVDQIARLLAPWFTERVGFGIAEYRFISEGHVAALQWELHWRNDEDGAACVSHQSHFFEVAGTRIRRHWLYCSGVRIVGPVLGYVPESLG